MWVVQMRSVLPKIITTLALAAGRSNDKQEMQALLDSLIYVLEESPSEVVAPSVQAACTQLEKEGNLRRHAELARVLSPDLQASAASSQIIATSVSAALQYGQFQPAPIRPWDWTPTLEAPVVPNLMLESVDPYAKLPNHGSLSLSSFGAVKLRDTIPLLLSGLAASSAAGDEATRIERDAHDDTKIARFLESERSLAEGRAESAAARAARSGAAALFQQDQRALDKANSPKSQAPKAIETIEISSGSEDEAPLFKHREPTSSSSGSSAAKNLKKRKSSADLGTAAAKRKKAANAGGKGK